MGKSQKRKGYLGEAEIVKKLQDRGVNCIRIPMSGSIWSWRGDIDFFNGIKGEVKRRKHISDIYYNLVNEYDIIIFNHWSKSALRFYECSLVLMSLTEFIKLWNKEGEKSKAHFEDVNRINNIFYKMLKEATYGFIRGDNKPWLVVMEMEDFMELYNK